MNKDDAKRRAMMARSKTKYSNKRRNNATAYLHVADKIEFRNYSKVIGFDVMKWT